MAAAALLVLAGGCTAPPEGPAAAKEKSAMFDLQAHRGGRGLRPENTLAAFRHALALGVTTLELDCGVTKDGVVVVSHDRALNPDHTRDAGGGFLAAAGPLIRELSFAELQKYDVGRIRPGSAYAVTFSGQQPVDGERIPRLSDVYALVAKSGNAAVRFNVETKINPLQPGDTVAPEAFVKAARFMSIWAASPRSMNMPSSRYPSNARIRSSREHDAASASTIRRSSFPCRTSSSQ